MNKLITIIFVFTLLLGCAKTPEGETQLTENCTTIADSRAASKKVCYENIQGFAVIEGDMILNKIDALSTTETKARSGLAITHPSLKRWTNGVIPYHIDPTALPFKDIILTAIEEYHSHTPIRFIERTTESDYVLVLAQTGLNACSVSNLGMMGGEQYIAIDSNLINSPSCSGSGTLVHELGHTLGLLHEHMREDRDKYIKIRTDLLSDPNFSKQVYFAEDLGEYDFSSIMHYSPYQGGTPSSPAFIKVDGGSLDGVGQRNDLSPKDIASILDLYSSSYIEAPDLELSSKVAMPTSAHLMLIQMSTNEDGFIFEYVTGNISNFDPSFSEMMRIPAISESLMKYEIPLTNLLPNTIYNVRVKSYNRYGRISHPSKVIAFTTPPVPSIPATPSNLKLLKAYPYAAFLSWTDNATDEDGFLLYRAPVGSSAYSLLGTLAKNTIEYVDTTVAHNSAYQYYLKAFNSTGESAASASLVVQVPNYSVVAPSGFAVVVNGPTSATFSWKDNSLDETYFQIQKASLAAGPWSNLGAVLPPNTVKYQSTELAANQTYYFRVITGNQKVSASSTVVMSKTPNYTLNAPSNFAVKATSANAVSFTWLDNSLNETAFQIQRANLAAGPWSNLGAVLPANTKTAKASGLAYQTHYFRVITTNAIKEVKASNVVGITLKKLPAVINFTITRHPQNLVHRLWNTASTPLRAKVGDTIVFRNTDWRPHRLATTICQGGFPIVLGAQQVAGGGIYQCKLIGTYDSTKSGPLKDNFVAGIASNALHIIVQP